MAVESVVQAAVLLTLRVRGRHLPMIVPFIGYGTTRRVRLGGRVVLGRPEAAAPAVGVPQAQAPTPRSRRAVLRASHRALPHRGGPRGGRHGQRAGRGDPDPRRPRRLPRRGARRLRGAIAARMARVRAATARRDRGHCAGAGGRPGRTDRAGQRRRRHHPGDRSVPGCRVRPGHPAHPGRASARRCPAPRRSTARSPSPPTGLPARCSTSRRARGTCTRCCWSSSRCAGSRWARCC